MEEGKTDFGFGHRRRIREGGSGWRRVSSVASRYDIMNDLMSGGLHRLWKAFTIQIAAVREGSECRTLRAARQTFAGVRQEGRPARGSLAFDINHAMLSRGRDRVIDHGKALPVAQCDAEKLPSGNDY